MKNLTYTLFLFIVLSSISMAQNPLLDATSGNNGNSSIESVSGSISVDVTKLVSTNDAQLLLDKLGEVTIQIPIASFYDSSNSNLKGLFTKVSLGNFASTEEIGGGLSVKIQEKGKKYIIGAFPFAGKTYYNTVIGTSKKALAGYTTLGTQSGKPGQTLTYTVELNSLTVFGESFGYNIGERKEFKVDIIPTSTGWIIDKETQYQSVTPILDTKIGRELLNYRKFLDELPTRLKGKTWVRKHKKETKRNSFTFGNNGEFVAFNAKDKTSRNGQYVLKQRTLIVTYEDGMQERLTIEYGNNSNECLEFNTDRINFSINNDYCPE